MLPNSILKECSQFLSQANGNPLYRALPRQGDGFRKVKMRKKNKYSHRFEKFFDKAFDAHYKDFRLRSMVAKTSYPETIESDREVFYIFPIDGYKVLYNDQINDYTSYIESFEPLIDHEEAAEKVLSPLFEYAYTAGNIQDAAKSGADILVYGIPYYYAIRESLIVNYNDFVSHCGN